jgi:hypothetical protein
VLGGSGRTSNNHPFEAPIDRERVRREQEQEQCVANRMLAGFLIVGWLVVNVLSGTVSALPLLLLPLAWCVRLSMRLTVLNSCLARGELGLIPGTKPASSESRGSAELPDVSDE